MPKTISPERILYEDESLLVVNKLSGELVVAADGEGKDPLYDFIHKTHPGLRVVHRLDFATSGVLVFAKGAEVVKNIRESKFKDWKKTYRTIVAKPMKDKFGTITRKLPARTKDELVDAVTHYRVLELFPHATYIEVDIDTGRKHQIRQHLQFIGHPLVNDAQYGDPRIDRAFKKHHKYRRFFLHACKLVFPHPITGKVLTVTAPLPKAFEEVLKELEGTKGKVISLGKVKKERRGRTHGGQEDTTVGKGRRMRGENKQGKTSSRSKAGKVHVPAKVMIGGKLSKESRGRVGTSGKVRAPAKTPFRKARS